MQSKNYLKRIHTQEKNHTYSGVINQEEFFGFMNVFKNIDKNSSLVDIQHALSAYGNTENHISLDKILLSIVLEKTPLETQYYGFTKNIVEGRITDGGEILQHKGVVIDKSITVQDKYTQEEAGEILQRCEKIYGMIGFMREMLNTYGENWDNELKKSLLMKINTYHRNYFNAVANEKVFNNFPEEEKEEFTALYVSLPEINKTKAA